MTKTCSLSPTHRRNIVTVSTFITTFVLVAGAVYLLFYATRNCQAPIARPNEDTLTSLGRGLAKNTTQFLAFFDTTFEYLRSNPNLCPTNHALYSQFCADFTEDASLTCQQATAVSHAMYDEAALQMDESTDRCDRSVKIVSVLMSLGIGFFSATLTGRYAFRHSQALNTLLSEADGPSYNAIARGQQQQ